MTGACIKTTEQQLGYIIKNINSIAYLKWNTLAITTQSHTMIQQYNTTRLTTHTTQLNFTDLSSTTLYCTMQLHVFAKERLKR